MAADLNTIIKQLTESSIIAQGKLENFVPPKAQPKSVDELVAQLVKESHLTQFQATQIKAGKAKALILGEYTILDKIGAGGMGQVFKAVHRRMERVVAIKMLPPAMTKDVAALARFQREVVAAAKLSHQNIVHANDAGQSGAAHFLVMEYVDGKDLSAMVKKDGPFPVNKAVNYILQAARGLEFAHGEGVVHRDIKPANLLLDKKGVVKILDMGLARIEQADGGVQSELTGTGTIMGTVDYMSPEQALDTRHADQRADIYSLGMSLYYLLAGKAAYGGDTAMQKLMAHQNQPIPSLQEVQTTVSNKLESVFKKMVAKRIEDRYQTMSDVVEALESLGYSGSSTGGKGDVASTLDLSSADRKKLLSQAKKKPLGSITDVVASEKTKHLVLKIVGGSFGTIVAPILVFYLIRHLDKEEKPAAPPAAIAPAATMPPVVLATNTTTQPPAPASYDVSQPWNTPAFQAWMKAVSAIPAEKQIEAVSKKLMELNPGFDGKVAFKKIESGVVTAFNLLTDYVTDISPVRALVGLNALSCAASGLNEGSVSDLSPLKGMELTTLSVWGCPKITDLSPLEGMSLASLNCNGTHVFDLAPLQNCKSLKTLSIKTTKVTPAQAAALQQALPNCKIEWDDPAKAVASQPNQPWNTPAFQQWVKATQALPAEKQIEAVSKKLMELNSGFDGKLASEDGRSAPKINKGVVTELGLTADRLTDISPLRALAGLQRLHCGGSNGPIGQFSDLSPLMGMKLIGLFVNRTAVADLTPLQGMSLMSLHCGTTQVSDLSPLTGMPLTTLWCAGSLVSDLSPLVGMNLTYLRITPKNVTRGLDVIRQMKSLTQIGFGGATSEVLPAAEFWKKYDAGDFGKPNPPAKLAYLDPAFQAWVKATQALPAEQQIEAVSKKLMELNPGFDGKLKGLAANNTPKVENGAVVEIGFWTDNVTDLSPVRSLPKLKSLDCSGSQASKGILSNLSPLEDMRIESLIFSGTQVSNLTPLAGLPLKRLYFAHAKNIADIAALRGLLLENLDCTGTQVSDLSPLEGMPLTRLCCATTHVTDISMLKTCRELQFLYIRGTEVAAASVAFLQEALPGCKIDWDQPAKATKPKLAYLDPAFQQWVAETQKLPAEQQIEAVGKKLMELNPGFDGKVGGGDAKGSPKIENGVVTEIWFLTDSVTDISPVRALAGLKRLHCNASQGGKSELSDLMPLRGMSLQQFACAGTSVSILSPLEGMPLTELAVSATKVSDLSPLRAMPLFYLNFQNSPVADLSPLRGMPLGLLICAGSNVSDLSSLAECPNMKSLNVRNTKITPAQVAALQKALSNCKIDWDDPAKLPIKLTYPDPAFQQWVKATQALPAEQQIEAVSKKLMELNPGFDGRLRGSGLNPMPVIESGIVTELYFPADKVADISPLRAFMGLKALVCGSSDPGKSKLSDLSPLEGMPLTRLSCHGTQVSDLTPLERCISLKSLNVLGTNVTSESVAALQKALSNCKILWDGAAKPKTPEPAAAGKK